MKRIEQASNHGIREADGGGIGLDHFFPLMVILYPVMYPLTAMIKSVTEIILLIFRQCNLFNGVQIEIFLRHFPGIMWFP